MSLRYRLFVSVLMVAAVLAGCSGNTEEKIYRRAHSKLAGLESYVCEAEIYIKGNKEPGEFKVKQWFAVPDKYRLEVLEPGIMKGKTTVFDGKRLWVYYPYIDQVFLSEDIETENEENLFIGFFLRDMMETEDIRYFLEEIDGTPALAIEIPVRGESRYFYRQKLYLNARDLTPIRLMVLDANSNITVGVKFDNFNYNPVLDPDLFNSDKASVSMVYEEWDPSGMFLQSLEDAGDYIGFAPLVLNAVPQGYTIDVIQVLDGSGGRALLSSYKSGGDSFTIIQKIYSKDGGDFNPEGEILNLSGRTAGYEEIEGMRKVTWIEGNIQIDVIGNISRGLLLTIAKEIR